MLNKKFLKAHYFFKITNLPTSNLIKLERVFNSTLVKNFWFFLKRKLFKTIRSFRFRKQIKGFIFRSRVQLARRQLKPILIRKHLKRRLPRRKRLFFKKISRVVGRTSAWKGRFSKRTNFLVRRYRWSLRTLMLKRNQLKLKLVSKVGVIKFLDKPTALPNTLLRKLSDNFFNKKTYNWRFIN